ncbi:MAG TPA: DinB family protein [Chitinophagaceae bacterium]|nr:DinB family protein [Chitinophagaceae bacterium]
MKLVNKPLPGEYSPHAIAYINLLPDDRLVLQHLANNFIRVKELVASLSEATLMHRYAAGKWTIKEILVHIVDDERIYAYRALRIARNDKTPLPGFEQDDYVPYSKANERSLENIFTEYQAVRQSTLQLFYNFNDDDFLRTGFANNNPMSVRAAAYHIAGHELHHLNIIRYKYL